ncbi:hypothetical protein TrVE_jg9099 [Triparma verrucosa]|uniref:BTB domain-containing protein n=1 Tax=Triparma verrucosa TaxID=1606542 RepID=A0A9W6ZAB2_9STRA|nr:hypothetical protein TrVE_jg9099 [Triparma verrucosa]
MFERSFDPVSPPSLPSISFNPPSANPQIIPATEARNRTVNAYELSSKIPKRCSFSCHSYITSDGEPRVIVFGGACIDEGAWKHYNDVHMLDGTTMEWEEVTMRGTGPSPRRCASSWMVGDSLYVWGGRYEDERTDAVDYNDMWRFDVGAKEWTVIEQVQEPVQRRSATCWTCETKDGTWLFMIGGEIRLLGRNDLRELVAIHRCKISQEQRTASWESGSIVMCHSFSKAHGLQHSNLYVHYQMFSSSSLCHSGSGFPRLYMFGGVLFDGTDSGRVQMLDFCYSTAEGIELLPLQNCRMTVIYPDAQDSDPGPRIFGTAANGFVATGYASSPVAAPAPNPDEHDTIYHFTGANWPANIFTPSGQRAYIDDPERKPVIYWQKIRGMKLGQRNGSGSAYVNGKFIVIGGGVYKGEYYGDTWVAEVGGEGSVEWPDTQARETSLPTSAPISTSATKNPITLQCNDGGTIETVLPVLMNCEYFNRLFTSSFSDAQNSVQNVPFPEPLMAYVIGVLDGDNNNNLTAFLGFILEVHGTLGILLNPSFVDATYTIFACAEYLGVPESAWTRLEDEALSLLKHLYHAVVNTPGGGFTEALKHCKEVAANGGMKRLFVHTCYIMKVGSIYSEDNINQTLLF